MENNETTRTYTEQEVKEFCKALLSAYTESILKNSFEHAMCCVDNVKIDTVLTPPETAQEQTECT